MLPDSPTGAKTILIVDDSRSNRRLIRQVLETRGHTCIEAEDGRGGLALAIEKNPDLLVLDIMMPDIDGFEVCEKLRRNESTAYLPILFLSAKDQVEDRVRGLLLGGDDFVTKPFSIKELVARIEGLLSRAQAYIDANPSTHLPGSTSITQRIHRYVETGTRFASIYFDLDNFKAYNDAAGFARGDEVIRYAGRVLRVVAADLLRDDDVTHLSHLGGDDFIVLCAPPRADLFAQRVLDLFREGRDTFHEPHDIERGYFMSVNRQGEVMEFPLLSLSAAIIGRRVAHVAELSQLAAELKGYAKARGGGIVVSDRRRARPEPNGPWLLLGESERQRAIAQRDALERAGFRVFVAFNGPDLIKNAHRLQPAAVLLGRSLPMMGTVEAHSLLQRLDATREIPQVSLADIGTDDVGHAMMHSRVTSALRRAIDAQGSPPGQTNP